MRGGWRAVGWRGFFGAVSVGKAGFLCWNRSMSRQDVETRRLGIIDARKMMVFDILVGCL
jgi:hypothetical protein